MPFIFRVKRHCEEQKLAYYSKSILHNSKIQFLHRHSTLNTNLDNRQMSEIRHIFILTQRQFKENEHDKSR